MKRQKRNTVMKGRELITNVLKNEKKPLSLNDIWNIAVKRKYDRSYGKHGTDAQQKKNQIRAELIRWCQEEDSLLERFPKGVNGNNISYSFRKNPNVEPDRNGKPTGNPSTGDIFIVHGRDEETKEAVSLFIHQLKLTPMILHEQPNEGKTILQKLDSFAANVAFAIVLLTPDDIGYSKDKPDKVEARARQNVIFELGYFLGKLGSNKVCALHKENVEMPSDYQGVIYLPMDKNKIWRNKLIQEFHKAGINVEKDEIISVIGKF